MALLDKLERKFGRYAIPNVTVYLIAGQSFFYLMFMTGQLDRRMTYYSAQTLMSGEWWRLLALPFDPPRQSLIFTLFAWYFFWMMGSALESHWGAFRYNAFLLLGFLITAAVSFVVPWEPMTNTFIAGSIFLAFATLFPDFQILLFFILPIQVKWLALLTWLGYAWQLVVGDWSDRLMVVAAIANYLIFFSRDIMLNLRHGKRVAARKAERKIRRDEPVHRCTTCGITDKTHPEMDFRYCPKCDGQYGYCKDHIFSHTHITKKK